MLLVLRLFWSGRWNRMFLGQRWMYATTESLAYLTRDLNMIDSLCMTLQTCFEEIAANLPCVHYPIIGVGACHRLCTIAWSCWSSQTSFLATKSQFSYLAASDVSLHSLFYCPFILASHAEYDVLYWAHVLADSTAWCPFIFSWIFGGSVYNFFSSHVGIELFSNYYCVPNGCNILSHDAMNTSQVCAMLHHIST